ncbi:hypothetical protein MTO96_004768 [Rhipicephalus appendiculatus]
MDMDTSPPSLEPGPLESDTPESCPPEPAPLEQPHLELPPLEPPPLEPPPLELPQPANEPDPGGLTFDPNSYLVPKEAAHPEPPDPPAECLSVVPLSNDDPEWTSETKENLILKLTKR